MNNTHKNINVRIPAELAKKIDELAKIESERTGFHVDRSQIVRRALTLSMQAQTPLKKAAKKASGV